MTAPERPVVYLASRSPRRLELLRQIGIEPVVLEVQVEEIQQTGESPAAHVARLGQDKARAGAAARDAGGRPPGPVVGADTCIALDGEVLGKPRDEVHGRAMLERLARRTHTVYTAVCVMNAGTPRTAVSASQVSFGAVSPADAARYWASGEPRDKAGGYAIQGRGAVFVERIEGSYSAVVGLPLYELCNLLRAAGFDLP